MEKILVYATLKLSGLLYHKWLVSFHSLTENRTYMLRNYFYCDSFIVDETPTQPPVLFKLNLTWNGLTV